ncbi:MAG: polysaccharide biosynthesis tyrosine autokinase [Acidimicrobiia bacterium]
MTQEETSTLELRDYLRVLRRRKWIIAVTIVVCVGIALATTLTKESSYATSTQVLIEQRLVDTLFVPNQQSNNPTDAARRRQNEILFMSSPRVRAKVQETLGREPESVSFATVGTSDVIEITSTGTKPRLTAETANAYAQTYIDVRRDLTIADLEAAAQQLQTRIADLDAKIAPIDGDLAFNPPAVAVAGKVAPPTDPRVTERNALASQREGYQTQLERMLVGISVAQDGGAQIIAEAGVPRKPISSGPTRNILAGLVLGIVLAIALAFLREYLDDTIKTKEDLEAATGLTVVGLIPALPDWKKRDATPLISTLQPRSPAAEAYRSVRTSVEFLSLDQPIGSIQVTSALASEGKTSTLANLAVTFARAGQRVIVLCCDLRRPRVHEFFGLTNRVGFTSVLLGDTPLASAIQAADPELPIGLVASGPLPPNPAELLASKRAVDVIEDLDRRCDLLLIDSPPILPVTDGLVISGLVDGVLLVASSGSSTKRGVKRAAELLRQVDAPLIGSILNGVGSKAEYGYTYGGDNRYYLDTPAPEKKPAAESRNGKNGKSRSRTSARAAR